MTQTRIMVRGQWRHRPETSIEAARHLSGLLASLATIHPALVAQTSSRPSRVPISTLPATGEALEPFVKKGRSVKDRTGEPWPARGFSVGAWNGNMEGPGASFSLAIGAFDDGLSAFNRVEISLLDIPGSDSLVSFSCVKRIVRAVVETMKPSSLDVTTRLWMVSAPSDTEFVCPSGGWMSYVAGNPPIELPVGVETEPLDSGVLMIATREDFSNENRSHQNAGYRLNKALEDVRKVENDLRPGLAGALDDARLCGPGVGFAQQKTSVRGCERHCAAGPGRRHSRLAG